MSAEERRGYYTPGDNEKPVAEHLTALRWCEGLVFVYPTWWSRPAGHAQGAGWSGSGSPTPPSPCRRTTSRSARCCTQIRFLACVSTLGSPWWWWTVYAEAARPQHHPRGLKVICAPRCRTLWLALHNLDTVVGARRRPSWPRCARSCRKSPEGRPLIAVPARRYNRAPLSQSDQDTYGPRAHPFPSSSRMRPTAASPAPSMPSSRRPVCASSRRSASA